MTGGGLSDELLQATFSIGLKGVKADNTKQVEELVLKTLLQITESGFESDAVEASMNTLEFRLRGRLGSIYRTATYTYIYIDLYTNAILS